MADLILLNLMAQAHETALKLGLIHDDLTTPVLVSADAQGLITVTTVAVPGVHPADVMAVTLLATRATRAAICFEGWGVAIEDRATINDLAAAESRGGTQAALRAARKKLGVAPMDHPDRFEMMLLLGQVKGESGTEYRCWKIVRTPGQPRRFEPHYPGSDPTTIAGRFLPMFREYRDLEALITRHAMAGRRSSETEGRRS